MTVVRLFRASGGSSARLAMRHVPYLMRFGLVGGTGVIVNYAILYLLAGGLGINHVAAAALATEGAILGNFVLNNLWTFRAVRREVSWARKVLRYNIFALGGLAISVGVLAALTYLFGMNYLLANAFAIGAAMFWNYAANYRWTWSVTTRRIPRSETDRA